MPKTINKISIASIESFVSILSSAANDGALIHAKENSQETRIIRQLEASSLITLNDHTNTSVLNSNIDPIKTLIIHITVDGAERLLQWENLLKENSLKYKVFKNIDRLAWLLIGALIVSLPKLLS